VKLFYDRLVYFNIGFINKWCFWIKSIK
jgi:hypothetical protein